MKGHERACEGLWDKVLQSRKASTAENMKFSEKKIIAIKSDNILPYFKANLFSYQTLPLRVIDCEVTNKIYSGIVFVVATYFYFVLFDTSFLAA